ncbi:MAG: hypothetical protein L6W00_16930 [Lentisphaeria bacterium]|nr:MAG: hypothetical protein L6W00_16930 [Lentisphaeria bacterium]
MISSEAFRKIKAVVLDVDGVLTDGRAGYGAEEEIKFFHLRDGHWMRMALRTGLKVGILSGRGSRANRRRAEELGLSFCYENCKDKLEGFERLLAEHLLPRGGVPLYRRRCDRHAGHAACRSCRGGGGRCSGTGRSGRFPHPDSRRTRRGL